jgi:hypothetical protein
VTVRYHYRGNEGEAVRRALLRPYEQQAEEERVATRRRAQRAETPAGEGDEAPANEGGVREPTAP